MMESLCDCCVVSKSHDELHRIMLSIVHTSFLPMHYESQMNHTSIHIYIYNEK